MGTQRGHDKPDVETQKHYHRRGLYHKGLQIAITSEQPAILDLSLLPQTVDGTLALPCVATWLLGILLEI